MRAVFEKATGNISFFTFRSRNIVFLLAIWYFKIFTLERFAIIGYSLGNVLYRLVFKSLSRCSDFIYSH